MSHSAMNYSGNRYTFIWSCAGTVGGISRHSKDNMTAKNIQNFAFTTEWLRITLGVVNALFTIVIVVENLLVLLVIVRTKAMRTRSNALLASLAVTDLLVGFLLNPITVLMLLFTELRQHVALNLIRRFLSVVLVGASIASIVVISYDRYMHLSKLTNYKDHMTKKKVVLCVLLAWTLAILLPLFRVVTKDEKVYSGAIVFLIIVCFTLMCACYGITLSIVKKKQHIMYCENGGMSNSIKAAKAILILIACFVIMVSPIMVYNLIVVCHDLGAPGFGWFQESTRDNFYVMCMTIVQANSAINPIIYYLRTPGFRKQINKTIGCFVSREGAGTNSRTHSSDFQHKNWQLERT